MWPKRDREWLPLGFRPTRKQEVLLFYIYIFFYCGILTKAITMIGHDIKREKNKKVQIIGKRKKNRRGKLIQLQNQLTSLRLTYLQRVSISQCANSLCCFVQLKILQSLQSF